MKKSLLFVLILATLSMASINHPYLDGAGTHALWHMDSVVNAKYVYDDDSVIIDRNANLVLNPNPVDTAGGPILTDPSVAGIGYPAGDSDFGNCLYLDGIDDSITIANSNLTMNLADLRVEGWFKADAVPNNQILVDRWGQLVIWANSDEVTVWAWDAGNSADTGIHANYSVSSADPTTWTHFAVEIVGESLEVYINDVLSTTTNKTVTYIGMRYNTESNFAGYLDEFRISEATAPTPLPQWAVPYADEAGTNYALWHFDALADPNTSGKTYELLPDDDSDNPGRNADLSLHSNTTKISVGEDGGPSIVDPVNENIGYPYDNSDFSNCAYFEDPVLVQSDSFRIANSSLSIDSSNLAVECWFKLDEQALSYVPSSTVKYHIIDRWGQFSLYVVQNTSGDFLMESLVWDANGGTSYMNSSWGIDLSGWVHIRLENYQGSARLLMNGAELESENLGTPAFGEPTEDVTYIGRRYNGQNFWGYLDEMKLSQAVYEVECGAWGYLPGDINEDCVVDDVDLQIMTEEWLNTTEPTDPLAVEGDLIQYETYNIPMISNTPVIDGNITSGEWDDAVDVYMAMPELTTAPNIGGYKYDIPSHSDFSGYYYMKWDSQNLYVGIKIYDDVSVFDAGYPDDFAGLAVNILESGSTPAEAAFYNMYRNYTGGTEIENDIDFNPAFNPDNAVVGSSVQADGWSIEAALKWNDFDGYSPIVGDEHGVALFLCDNDTAGDGVRDTFLYDAGNGDTTVIDNPTMYKTVVLTSGPKCGDLGYFSNDVNRDCYVDIFDFSDMAAIWLQCSDPTEVDCIDAR